MDERLRCQCKRWAARQCESRMTQEDLLCDSCRHGCSLVTVGGELPGAFSFHTRVTEFNWRRAETP